MSEESTAVGWVYLRRGVEGVPGPDFHSGVFSGDLTAWLHILVPETQRAALAASGGTRGMVNVVRCWEGPWRRPGV